MLLISPATAYASHMHVRKNIFVKPYMKIKNEAMLNDNI